MEKFKSWMDYWRFENDIKHNSRYAQKKEIVDFLTTVLATSTNRVTSIRKGQILWRAQLGSKSEERIDNIEENGIIVDQVSYEDDVPLPPERMKPLRNEAKEGRINPKGVPYLYLASTPQTAMAEIRPWIGETVTLGQFSILKDLTVIDCSIHHGKHPFHLEEPPPEQREETIWAFIDNAFSRPVIDREDKTGAYAPTQVIADLFKQNGYEGILYKSSLDKEGYNVALFDINAADLIYCALNKVLDVQYKFSQTGDLQFIKLPTQGELKNRSVE